MKLKPKVLVPGDPKCVHYSDIVGDIGTCRKCGRVLDYSQCQGKDEFLAERGRKGGKKRVAIHSS